MNSEADWRNETLPRMRLGFKSIALSAAIVHFFFGLYQGALPILAPGLSRSSVVLDWILMSLRFLNFSALSWLFFIIYAHEPALAVSKSVRWMAMAALVVIGARNAGSMISLMPWVIHEVKDGFAWKYYPSRQMWSLLRGSLPPITVATLLAFLERFSNADPTLLARAADPADGSGQRLIRQAARAAALTSLASWSAGVILLLIVPQTARVSFFNMLPGLAATASLTLFFICLAEAHAPVSAHSLVDVDESLDSA